MARNLDIELDGRLAAARKRLPELRRETEESEKAVTSLRADLASAQNEAKKELEVALIEGRAPDSKPATHALKLAEKLHGAQARYATGMGAVQRAREIVTDLEAQIAEGRKTRELEGGLPTFHDFRKQLASLRASAIKLNFAWPTLTVGDILETDPSDPGILHDLNMLGELNRQLGSLERTYTDWREKLGLRAA